MPIDWEKTGALFGGIAGVIGMATGGGGLWLGILNRRHAREQTSTRVRVEAILQGEEKPANRRFLVRVINDSAFAVRIDSVGLVLREGDGSRQTAQLVELDIDRSSRTRPAGLSLDEATPSDLPIEIAARSSIVMRLELRETIALGMMPFDQAFAITATGHRFVSDRRSPLVGKTLKQMQATGGGQGERDVKPQ